MYERNNLADLRKALLLSIRIYDDDSMETVDSFYAPSPPRVGEEFRDRTVVSVAWNNSQHTGVQVHVYTKVLVQKNSES